MSDDIKKGLLGITVDETEVSKLVEGSEIKVIMGALEKDEFEAKLTFVAPKGIELGGAVQFKIKADVKIPESVNYDILSGLSNEVKSKFKKIRPKTMGQALRIDGITPAASYILLSHVKRKSIKNIA